jgi:cell division protein FtsZ
MMIKFDHPKNQSSIIKVIGVGGGGSNAVNHMFSQGIRGVDFVVCNTDRQALDMSVVPVKIPLGKTLTDGMGAGSIPEVGKNAAMESIEEIREVLQHNTKMVFVTAGMGGGTGTGAAPVIASVARELGILTVGIVTVPFGFEGKKRKMQAEQGIEDLREYVDTLLIICNDKLRELHGDLKLSEAFARADNILTIAAKGIAEIITVTGYINVDFNDVNTVMKNSGAAIMGSGMAEGESRAVRAVEMALSSPLLNDNEILGAQNMLLYIASGTEEVSMDEVSEITEYIQQAAGATAEIIWGNGIDESLGNQIQVTIIATGFHAANNDGKVTVTGKKPDVIVHPLVEPEVNKETAKDPDPIHDITLIQKPQEEVKTPVIVHQLYDDVPVKQTPVLNEPVPPSDKDIQMKITQEVNTATPQLSNLPQNNPENNLNTEEAQTSVAEDSPEILHKARERVQKLRDMSIKLRTPNGLNEIEKEPAYVRRKVELTDPAPSSETEINRFVLSSDDDGNKTEIRSNPFLHDNVD